MLWNGRKGREEGRRKGALVVMQTKSWGPRVVQQFLDGRGVQRAEVCTYGWWAGCVLFTGLGSKVWRQPAGSTNPGMCEYCGLIRVGEQRSMRALKEWC